MDVIISCEEERNLITSVLTALGATTEESAIQADILVEADLRGYHSHGLQRLPVLVGRIRSGLIALNVVPVIRRAAPAVFKVDGRRGLGPFVAHRALKSSVETAISQGAVVVAIGNSSHLGMIGYYGEKLAEEGLISFAMTTSEALVHPEGGAEALVGTNPLAVASPTASDPFVFDMATAVSAFGKILDCKHRGLPLPKDWAVDADGIPTTDPEAALGGSLNPVGQWKGYGLGVSIGLLVGLLSETALGADVLGTLDTVHPATKGDLFIVLDPRAFGVTPSHLSEASKYLDRLRSSRPARGGPPVRVPGDRSREMRRQRLQEGIPLAQEVWDAARRLYAKLD